MTDTLKEHFEYKRSVETDPEKFYVTYHADYPKAFYTFINECVEEASNGCFKYADNQDEFLSENIGKKIKDEVGELVDGKRYFINTFHVYDEASCSSEIYFDMKSAELAIEYVANDLANQLEELSKIWGEESKYKVIEELGKLYTDEFEIYRKNDKAKHLEAMTRELKD